jgi:hypothetical protein
LPRSFGCNILNVMGLDVAYQKALEDMAQLSPHVAASMSGASFDGDRFTISFLHRSFTINFPEVKVAEVGCDTPPPRLLEILLMHYLVNADGTPVSGMWITYRHLPGSYLFEQRFTDMALRPLLDSFGNDAEGFSQAAVAIGGKPMTRTGDAAFRFMALPKIPMGCILYLGDDEVSPSINILFDAAAPHYLPTEDLSYLGLHLRLALIGHKG